MSISLSYPGPVRRRPRRQLFSCTLNPANIITPGFPFSFSETETGKHYYLIKDVHFRRDVDGAFNRL